MCVYVYTYTYTYAYKYMCTGFRSVPEEHLSWRRAVTRAVPGSASNGSGSRPAHLTDTEAAAKLCGVERERTSRHLARRQTVRRAAEGQNTRLSDGDPHRTRRKVHGALTALGVRAAGCCQSDKGVAKRRMHCCGLTSHVAIDMERKAGLDWPRDRFSREEVLGRKATRHSVRHPVEVQEACRTSRQRSLAYNQIGSMPACLRSR
jgi:hypothetical protein